MFISWQHFLVTPLLSVSAYFIAVNREYQTQSCPCSSRYRRNCHPNTAWWEIRKQQIQIFIRSSWAPPNNERQERKQREREPGFWGTRWQSVVSSSIFSCGRSSHTRCKDTPEMRTCTRCVYVHVFPTCNWARKAHLNNCDSEGAAINREAEDQRAGSHLPSLIAILTFRTSADETGAPDRLLTPSCMISPGAVMGARPETNTRASRLERKPL